MLYRCNWVTFKNDSVYSWIRSTYKLCYFTVLAFDIQDNIFYFFTFCDYAVLEPNLKLKFVLSLKITNTFSKNSGKKYTSGPRYWNVPVLVNTGTFLVYQYCPEMWYLRSLERAGGIQKQTILECQNGLVLSNTRVPVSGTWSLLFPNSACILK